MRARIMQLIGHWFAKNGFRYKRFSIKNIPKSIKKSHLYITRTNFYKSRQLGLPSGINSASYITLHISNSDKYSSSIFEYAIISHLSKSARSLPESTSTFGFRARLDQFSQLLYGKNSQPAYVKWQQFLGKKVRTLKMIYCV